MANSSDGGIVSVDVLLSHASRRKWLKLAVVGLVVIVVIGGCLSWAWWQHDKDARNVRNAAAQAVKLDNKEFTSLQSSTSNLAADNQESQAITSWTDYAAKTPDHSHESIAYLNAAALYITNKQFDQALTLVKKAEAADGVTFDEAEVAATVYTALGNTQQAIHYYQEAYKLVPAGFPDESADKAGFQQAIKELQAKP